MKRKFEFKPETHCVIDEKGLMHLVHDQGSIPLPVVAADRLLNYALTEVSDDTTQEESN